MKQLVLSLLLLLGISTQTFGDGADYILISNIGTSARAIGIGSVEGFSTEADTVFENPAGLARMSRKSLSAFGTTFMDEVNYRNIALSTPTKYGHFGLGYMQATIDSIPKTAVNSDTNEYYVSSLFDYNSSVYKLSYAYDFTDTVYAGLTYSYYSTTFDSLKGLGSNVDLGFLMMRDSMDISLMFKNIMTGSKANYNNGTSENIPRHSILAVNIKLPANIDIMPQLKAQQNNLLWSLGGTYTPTFLPLITVSSGYKQFLTVTEQHRQNATFGLGLNLFRMHFHYAYERSDYVLSDHKNYFSISMSF